MKFTIVCLFAVVAVALAKPETYTDKYDNINIDEILENERLLDSYIKCILGAGKCTTEGKELKSHIQDGLETGCAKCTEAQQKGTRKVIKFLINNKPQHWNDLKAKYDPKNIYSVKYEKEYKTLVA